MNVNWLPLFALLFKHTGEIPNIIAKGTSAAKAMTTKGIDKIDPACDFLQSFKPLEADLIAGGYMAVPHQDETTLRAAFNGAGLGGMFEKFLEFAKNHPELVAIALKFLGL